MVRNLVELPKFLVFNSGTNSLGNSSNFAFYLLLFTLYRFMYLLFSFGYGVIDIFMSTFQMELNDYPHIDLTEDGRLCSTGQHCPGFPRVLYDTIHPSWLRWGHSGLPLPTVHDPRHGPVRGQHDDTLQPHGAVVRVHHR
jgi:hypothetical protein